MLWDGEPMYWDDTTWSSTVPIVTRGHYLWMRTKVGIDGEWHYSRVSAEYVSEAQFLGAVTTLPTTTLDGLPLIPGDYFVASEEFTDGTYTYRKGFVYEFRDPLWALADLSNPKNTQKGIDSLSAILEDGTMVEDSHAALYGWFKNLVAQNAVFQNLYARNVQVGDGDGTEGSGFRFRARDYDRYGNKLTTPTFDVYFGDKMLFEVDSDGKIFFGSNFFYDPTYNSNSGAIRSTNDNVIIDAGGAIDIKNGWYRSNLQCASFRSMPKDPPSQPTYVQISGTGFEQLTTLYAAVGQGILGELVPCVHSSESSIKYMQTAIPGDYVLEYRFLNSSGGLVGTMRATVNQGRVYSGTSPWENTSFTLTLGNPSDVAFQLLTMDGTSLSIGTLSSDTRKGELYYVQDGTSSTGTVHIKL